MKYQNKTKDRDQFFKDLRDSNNQALWLLALLLWGLAWFACNQQFTLVSSYELTELLN